MARGKRPIDPKLVADFDIMICRESLHGIAQGAASPWTVLDIARLQEALLEQYRDKIPFNYRHELDMAVRRTLDHAIAQTAMMKAERLAARHLLAGIEENSSISEYWSGLDLCDLQWTCLAAQQAVGFFDEIVKKTISNRSPGRPSDGAMSGSSLDLDIVLAAVNRFSPSSNDIDMFVIELRETVKEAVAEGRLHQLGSTDKENLDAHIKRITRLARRMISSPN